MFNILGTENKFEKLAEIAANEHVDKGVSLNDSIVKLAEENELNPEQIKRVVEAANVKVFQKNFEDESREGHKNVDFDVADPKVIIKRIYVIKKQDPEIEDPSGCTCGHSEDPFSRMPSPLDFFKNLGMDNFTSTSPGITSTKVITMKPSSDDMDRPTLVIRIKKAKANLEKQAYAISEDYVDKAVEFSKQFRRAANDPSVFQSLCKEAYDHKGAEVEHTLNFIGREAKQQVPSYQEHEMQHGLCKVAGYIDSNLEKVFELNDMIAEYNRYETASQLAEEQLQEMK